MKNKVFFVLLFMVTLLSAFDQPSLPVPQIPFDPEIYDCPQVKQAPVIDGKLDDPVWVNASWTKDFGDIEGNIKPAPRYRTRVKMLWDEQYFYIGAELEEPDLWATLKERDAVIFHDNDFEVFIDPNGDTHEYGELEINALNTVWDLLLTHPYRENGIVALNAWDIQGLKTAVHLDGTLNHPGDKDQGWTVEIALPWSVLGALNENHYPPKNQYWRVNFSRVEWQHELKNGEYTKKRGMKGETLPEANWTWSPQGLIAMHYPEMWGYVYFRGSEYPADVKLALDKEEEYYCWVLRQVYYRESTIQMQTGRYSNDRDSVLAGWTQPFAWRINPYPPMPVDDLALKIQTTDHGYEAAIKTNWGPWSSVMQHGRETTFIIDQTGRIRKVHP